MQNIINQLKQYVYMTDQVTDTKFGPKYFVHTNQMSGFKSDKKKYLSVQGAPGGPNDLSYCQILNQTF